VSDIWQLGIESSAPTASLVLLRNGAVVLQRVVEAEQNHSAVLISPLAEVLEALPAGEKLAEVVVATGPGSYNGARVGIAAGQGIALIHECATVGVPSLEAIEMVRAGGPCLAVGDARRGAFFTIPMAKGLVQAEPTLLEHEEFVSQISAAAAEGAWVFCLEAVARLRLPEELAAQITVATPEARLAVAAWEARDEEGREQLRNTPLQPFYLRPPNITEPKKR
jgi:tRNA threonylcarbamoyladenosine biosynthesis protein TsaB